MSDLILYTFWRSSCAHRVRLALGYKQLAYTPVFMNLTAGAQHAASYLAKNPTGYVPALEIDGHLLIESVAILEYLEETRPETPLMPAEAHDRARVRALVQMVASGIQPLQNLNVLTRVSDEQDAQLALARPYNERGIAFARHYNERGLAAIEQTLAALEKEGLRGPFCYGEHFGMADLFLIPQLAGARRFGADLSRVHRVVRAVEAANTLAFVKAAAPEAQPDAAA